MVIIVTPATALTVKPTGSPATARAERTVFIKSLHDEVNDEDADFAQLESPGMARTPAADEANSAAGHVGLLRQLSRAAEADRLRAISHLVMGVAHELNTPLEIISHAAELVARDGNDEVREAAALIRNNVTRASRLIRRLRSLSVDNSADALQPVDVVSAVTDAIVLHRRTSVVDTELDVRVIDQLDHAEGDTRWHGYPLYLTDVLLSLLSNAEHHAYHDAGGPVEIVLARHGDRLHVTVADRGTGIP